MSASSTATAELSSSTHEVESTDSTVMHRKIDFFNASALANAGLVVRNVSLAVTFWTHSWGA